jgi:ADP-ribosylglycohydrolase
MPEWTRRLTRELDTFAEQNATTTLPVPIALNQPPEPLRLGPSDDAEWAAFAAEAVLRAGDPGALGDLSRERRMRAAIDLSWNAIASEVAAAADRAPEVESAVLPLRARISVRAGLGNLATGLRPPATGHDNPHYFDDAACVRACVLAVAHAGDPQLAAELAEFDARYTQDGDGVHGARAMAAALSLALAGADADTCVAAALAELPESTEIGRNARHALTLARDSRQRLRLVPLLEHQIVDHVYSYGIAAAETVPVALALATASHGRIAEAVPAAACLSRVADSAPALVGALTGAIGGGTAIPASWRDACRTLSGCALPRLTGTDLVELAELLAATELAFQGDDSDMTPTAPATLEERITRSLVGAAVGDALGGPVEGYSPEQIAERHGGRVHGIVGPWNGDDWRTARPIAPYHKGDGHVTDDTLMTHALVRVYAKVRDHLDAYAVADHLVPDLMTTPRWIPEWRPRHSPSTGSSWRRSGW